MPPESTPGLPYRPTRRPMAVGWALGGVALLTASAVAEASWVEPVVGLIVVAPFYGLPTWLVVRRQRSRWQLRVVAVDGPVADAAAARARGRRWGRLWAVVVVVVQVALGAALSLAFGDPAFHIVGGIAWGSAGWMWLEDRDLVRWQTDRGGELWLRSGLGIRRRLRAHGEDLVLVRD